MFFALCIDQAGMWSSGSLQGMNLIVKLITLKALLDLLCNDLFSDAYKQDRYLPDVS
jgi:hypothetical protein